MAWEIIINDPRDGAVTNISNRVMSFSSTEKLGNQSNTFNVTCKLIDLNHKWGTITVTEDGVLRHSGIIVNQTDSDAVYKLTEFECMDWTYILPNRIIAKTYNKEDEFGGRPDLIIKDILGLSCPEIGTTQFVDVVPFAIEAVQFPYVQVSEAIAQIMDFIPDWRFYVDQNKEFHLFRSYESDGTTFSTANDGSVNIRRETLKMSYLGDRQFNRIWIIGAKQASPKYIDVWFNGDGQQRYFNLPYEPNYTDMYVNGVKKKVLLEGNDDESADFLINKKNKVVYIPANITTPFTGEIRAHFRPTVQVIDYFENSPNIAIYGVFEKAIKNKDVTDRLSARQYGKAEIKRRSTDRRQLSFQTLDKTIRIGQRCIVDIDRETDKGKWSIKGNFLVTSVTTNIGAEHVNKFEVRQVEMEELL